jgi:hypothetical protein
MCCAIFLGATHIYNMHSSLFACCCIILFFYFTVTEMVGPTKRLFASFCVYFGFCIGNYILLSMAFLIRDWTVLYWAITVPIGAYTIVLLWVNNLIKIRSHSHPPFFNIFLGVEIRGIPIWIVCEWSCVHSNENSDCETMKVVLNCFAFYEQSDWSKKIPNAAKYQY